MITKNIPLKVIFRGSILSVSAVTAYATAIYILALYLDLPDISVSIPAFMGTGITLLLSFKLNQSYDRWWEGRKIWGAIVNDSRSLVVQLRQFIKTPPEQGQVIRKVAYRQIGWCHELTRTLRRLNQEPNLEKYVGSEEWSTIRNQTNLAFALMDQHGRDIRQLHQQNLINDYQQIQLDQTIVRLTASMGQAERIKNTIFPTAYAIMLNIFLYIFLGIFALAVAETIGAWQIGLSTLISIPFLLLLRTARALQDPFENRPSDTPMTTISNTIERNLMELLNEPLEEKDSSAGEYYKM